MSTLVHSQKKQEDKMQSKITSLTKEVKHDEWLITSVQKENKKLEKKENELEKNEKKLEAWGEEESDSTEIHQSPLKHHIGKSSQPDIGDLFGSIAEALKGSLDSFKKMHKTGPAEKHHMEKAFNFGNILKPGAHPKHKKPEDDKAKKDEKKTAAKPVSKADELRNRLKPVKIE